MGERDLARISRIPPWQSRNRRMLTGSLNGEDAIAVPPFPQELAWMSQVASG